MAICFSNLCIISRNNILANSCIQSFRVQRANTHPQAPLLPKQSSIQVLIHGSSRKYLSIMLACLGGSGSGLVCIFFGGGLGEWGKALS